MIRPQIWVLAGPNGAGKSTIARRFFIGRIPFVNADDIARDLDPNDVNSISAHMRAGRIALELRDGYLNRSETFAMETTVTGKSELALMRRAREAGYKVNLIFVGIGNVAIFRPGPPKPFRRDSEHLRSKVFSFASPFTTARIS